MRRGLLYLGLWLVAVVAATGIALAAVGAVGDAARGRGPLGAEIGPLQDADPSPGETDLEERTQARRITGDYGVFLVSCQGPFAVGEGVEPATDRGWRVLSYEPGPDDDVDAVFTRTGSSIEVEVFCNQGRPTVGDIERARFLDED